MEDCSVPLGKFSRLESGYFQKRSLYKWVLHNSPQIVVPLGASKVLSDSPVLLSYTFKYCHSKL